MLKMLVAALFGLVLAACSADDETSSAELFTRAAHSPRDVEEAYCGYAARCVPHASYLQCMALAQQLSDDPADVDAADAQTCISSLDSIQCGEHFDCPLF